MTTVATADATAYSLATRASAAPVLNLEPLDELANAVVNGYDNPYQEPHSAIDYNGETANWNNAVANMLFSIERPSGDIVCWGVLRDTSSSNYFYPDVKSGGDFGYATNEGLLIQDLDVIRIYNNTHIWALVSRVGGNGTQYKRWDESYSSQGLYPPPVANIGRDQQQWVDETTALATFSFTSDDSFDWQTGPNGGISSIAWTIPSAATITAGGLTLDNITFTIAAGTYQVKCVVTNLRSKTTTATRTIYANDRGSNTPFSWGRIQSIGADATDVDGWGGQFVLTGDLSGLLYPGQKCLFSVPVYYDGVELNTNGSFINQFVGYLNSYTVNTETDGRKTTTLSFISPLKICKLLPSATQFFEEKTSPSSWTEVKNGFSNPAFAAWYILKWHTTVLDAHDFIYEAALLILRRRVFGFAADNINAHLATVGAIMSGVVGCRSDGTITLTQNPNLLTGAQRNALDTKYTFTDKSLRAPLNVTPRLRAEIAYIIMAGISYNGDPSKPSPKFAAKAPGKAQGQGVTKTNIPDISITTQGGAAELYRIVGHHYAYLNNPLSKVPALIFGMWDICEPADADWLAFDISDAYLPVDLPTFGARWKSGMRWTPAKVTRTWTRSVGGWVKQIAVEARVESSGLPGVFHPTYRGEIAPFIDPGGWIDLDITMPALDLDLSFALPTLSEYNVAMAFNSVGVSQVSTDFNGKKPNWEIGNGGLSGDVIDQCLDEQAPGQGAYILIHDSSAGNLRVYYNSDITVNPKSWSLSSLLSVSSATFFGRARIVNNASQTLLAVMFDNEIKVYRKPAAGGWDAGVTVGSQVASDPEGAALQFGVGLSGVNSACVGRDSVTGGYKVHRATSVGGAYSAVANHPGGASSAPMPAIAWDGSGRIIASYDTSAGIGSSGTYISTDLEPGSLGVQVDIGAIRTSDEQGVDGTANYQAINRQWVQDSEEGITHTVSESRMRVRSIITWPETDGDPPGAPDYFPPGNGVPGSIFDYYNGTVHARMKFLSADGSVLDTQPWQQWTTLNTHGTLQTVAASGNYPDSKRYVVSYDMTYTPGVPFPDVATWDVEVASTTGRNYFGDYRSSSPASPQEGLFIHYAASGSMSLGGNVITYTDQDNDGEHLYQISAVDVWTDITALDANNNVLAVKRYNAMTIFGTDIYAIITDSTGAKAIIKGNTTDGSWVTVKTPTSYDWIRTLNGSDEFIVGGEAVLDVSVDDGETYTNRIGVWGGSIEQVTDCVTAGFYYGH